MKFTLKYLKPYWLKFVLSTVCIVIATLCDLMLPTIMSQILDNGVYYQDFSYITKYSLVMLIVAACSLVFTLLGSFYSCDAVAWFCADVRADVFRKVNQMNFDSFGKLGTAALVTRATHDVQTLSWVAAELAGTVFTIPVLFFGGFFLTLQKDALIALILLAVLPVIFWIVILIGRKVLPLWDISDKYIDKQNAIMRERLRGIRVIRAFNAETAEHSKISTATEEMAENIIKGNVAMGIVRPLATLILNLTIVVIIYLGGWQLETSSGLTGGDIFAVIQYVGLVSSGIIMAAFTIISFPHAKVAAQRISQVLDAEGLDREEEGIQADLKGEIEIRDLTFTYDGASDSALNRISLHIRRGQKVAIIGGTGSGKSSLVSQILGFRKPTSGQVFFDGIPMDKLRIGSVRKSISCALQNASIYSGTVAENVRMGKLDATDEELWAALEIAQADDFVKANPDGLQYVIKQSGKNLSGGQKQRISIARSLIKPASIYIFDDSFSALDFLTEARLRKALSNVLAGVTQIVITQRVTSAMFADCIYVMDKGSIVDFGTHEHLLQNCEVYRQIYASQTGGGVV